MEYKNIFFIILGCLCASLPTIHGAKTGRILMLPLQTQTHLAIFKSVAQELAQRGHKVTVVFSSAKEVPDGFNKTGMSIMKYTSSAPHLKWESEEFQNHLTFACIYNPNEMWKTMDKLTALYVEEGEAMLNDQAFSDNILKQKFDLAIVSGDMAARFLYILPYRLNIPYVSLASVVDPYVAGLPVLPSFVPNVWTSHTEEMNFQQRLSNTLDDILLSFTHPPALKDTLVHKHAVMKPFVTLRKLAIDSQAWLINTDYLVDYHLPSMPNTIYVGGLTTRQPRTISPPALKKYLDDSTEGVIIVSFGAVASYLPPLVSEKLVNALKDMRPLKVLWGFGGKPSEVPLPKNIKIEKWLPLNDVLAHPNVKLFVTNCGANAQFESVYHGVPMLNLPITNEQHYNAARSQYKGLSITIDLHHFKTEDLTAAMKRVIKEPKFKDNVKMAGTIFKARHDRPTERAAELTELVIQFGGKHLRSNLMEMSAYEYYMVDVVFVLIFVSIICAFLLKWLTGVFYIFLCSFLASHDKKSKSD
ncbi:2-hydroxyacylsphingosine 1-beta-galactosyltransferase-like [Lingula anatina]|uniref:UDP-glucuronosyltransferase n=1 Tax=Lingula anatina TaxID=7574 RepID=A0A2R2MJG3_LINAN|nr:2-hydroxyacylsphingosine 1-beta-galactosyltransferase-like [Lingula anatina]|eukprot:XP_023930338.1 2-hydroxyacylsphingosine 1-beta-galactosyltransferase-like [Lingula anatina]